MARCSQDEALVVQERAGSWAAGSVKLLPTLGGLDLDPGHTLGRAGPLRLPSPPALHPRLCDGSETAT